MSIEYSPEPTPPREQTLDVEVSDLVFQVLGLARQRDVVPLGSAFPSPSLFPLEKLSRSLAGAMRRLDPWRTVEDLSPGSEELRQANAFRNSSLQGAYLMLAARALGLDCGPMSGFDNAAVDAEFFSDQPSVRSNFICSIGYGDPASIFGRSPRPEFGVFNRVL